MGEVEFLRRKLGGGVSRSVDGAVGLELSMG